LGRHVKPRRYDSPIRAEAAERTRQGILAAARRLFIEQGYAAMTMQAVADEAGVALDTVYATVGKKPLLARLLVETAISNTDREVPAEQREYVQQLRAARSAREKLAIYADAVVDIQGRLAPLVRAVEAAASAHPDLAAIWREIAERRAENMKKLATELVRTGEVRKGLSIERIADVLWATNSPQLFTLLVTERGWSADDYKAWLADAWCRLLL
jgi:AcrR family transcriptional regulator